MTNKYPRICGPRLMIKQLESMEKTDGGIILPDQVKDDANYLNNIGQIVSMGDMSYVESNEGQNRFGRNMWANVGDYVVWGRHAGQRFLWKDEVYVMINDDQVLMVVDDPQSFGNDVYRVKYTEHVG